MTENRYRFLYGTSDWLGMMISWIIYCFMRYEVLNLSKIYYSFEQFLTLSPVLFNGLIVSFLGLFVFYLSGYYNKIVRKSRAQELVITFFSVCFVSLGIFIGVLLDDLYFNPQAVYLLMTGLFLLLFFCIYIPRLVITSYIKREVFRKQFYSHTLILGTGLNAKLLIDEFQNSKRSMGYKVIGCVDIGEPTVQRVTEQSVMGDLDSIGEMIDLYDIKDLILAPDVFKSSEILPILYRLYIHSIPILLLRDEKELLTGKYRSSGEILSWVVLSNLTEPPISETEKNLKWVLDYIATSIGLIATAPLFLIIGLLIKCTSKGPCFYSQVRVGKNGKLFKMYKFRTMIVNSEPMTPLLSSPFDSRITPIGRFLRRYRLDELPQLINILKGEMSIVGPRPEREYYIDQIVKYAPYYRLVQRVRPGLTSWGMVKFGYAQNIDEMIERLDYDVRYIENCSLMLDIKIIMYTIKVVISGRGL